jgi:hypothetical protein
MKRLIRTVGILSIVAVASIAARPAQAGIIHVPADYATIQDASMRSQDSRNKMDVPYQSMLKLLLSRSIERERADGRRKTKPHMRMKLTKSPRKRKAD